MPTIEITEPDDDGAARRALPGAADLDDVAGRAHLGQRRGPLRDTAARRARPRRAWLAAIGPGTAGVLAGHHLEARPGARAVRRRGAAGGVPAAARRRGDACCSPAPRSPARCCPTGCGAMAGTSSARAGLPDRAGGAPTSAATRAGADIASDFHLGVVGRPLGRGRGTPTSIPPVGGGIGPVTAAPPAGTGCGSTWSPTSTPSTVSSRPPAHVAGPPPTAHPPQAPRGSRTLPGACRFPSSAGCAGCAAPRPCAGWWPRPGSRSTTSSPRCSCARASTSPGPIALAARGRAAHPRRRCARRCAELADLGVPAVILFGVPAHKDADGLGRLGPRRHRAGRAARPARRRWATGSCSWPTSASTSTPTTATAAC